MNTRINCFAIVIFKKRATNSPFLRENSDQKSIMRDELLHKNVLSLIDFIGKSEQDLLKMDIRDTLIYLREVQRSCECFGIKPKCTNHQKLLDVIVLLETASRYEMYYC